MTCAERERGSALIAVMLLVVVVATFASLAQSRSRDMLRDTVRERGQVAARYAAEGGLAKARHALRLDPLWAGTRMQVGTGEVDVRVVRVAAQQWQIVAQATTHPAGELGNPVRVTLEEEFGARYRYRAEKWSRGRER